MIKLATTAVIGAALGLAACGGSSSAGSKASAISKSPPTKIYHLQLSGSAEPGHGASHGTGIAIIAFHGRSTICWRFAHLHGFTQATSARIYAGASGRSGKVAVALSNGPRLHHQGCIPISPSVTQLIWQRPTHYYVNVHSSQFPSGAVRAQL